MRHLRLVSDRKQTDILIFLTTSPKSKLIWAMVSQQCVQDVSLLWCHVPQNASQHLKQSWCPDLQGQATQDVRQLSDYKRKYAFLWQDDTTAHTISSTTFEHATVKFRYSVQCNVLSHSHTAVVMTKTACIHWEFFCSFFPGSSTFPTSQNVIKLLDTISSKLFANHSIYTQFYKHLPFVPQHYSSFFYFMCLFYGFLFEYSYAFLVCSITILCCCISRLFSTPTVFMAAFTYKGFFKLFTWKW